MIIKHKLEMSLYHILTVTVSHASSSCIQLTLEDRIVVRVYQTFCYIFIHLPDGNWLAT